MHLMVSPITLEKGAQDQNETEPVHLAKGVVTEARGKQMEQGQVGLA